MTDDDLIRHPVNSAPLVAAIRNLCLALDYELAKVASTYNADCRDAYVFPAADVVNEIRAQLDELERLFGVFRAGSWGPDEDGITPGQWLPFAERYDPPRQPGQ